MCSERDRPLKCLYRRIHAKLAHLAGSGQLVWAAGCELSLALVHARRPVWPGETSETILRVAPPRKTRRPITHEWIDLWTRLLPGQHRWAQLGATDEPREFRLAGSRQDKRLERAIPLTTHLWVNSQHFEGDYQNWWLTPALFDAIQLAASRRHMIKMLMQNLNVILLNLMSFFLHSRSSRKIFVWLLLDPYVRA